MKRIASILFVLIVFSLMGNKLLAQDFKNKEVRDFFVSINELKEDEKCSYYAYELLTSKMLTPSDTYGIYRIGLDASDSFEHLLLRKKQTNIFINCYKSNLYQILNVVFSFFDDCDFVFTDSKKLSYIRGVMNIYYRNENAIPW